MLGAVPGAVTGVGTTITSGPADGMPAITSAVTPTGATAAGIVARVGRTPPRPGRRRPRHPLRPRAGPGHDAVQLAAALFVDLVDLVVLDHHPTTTATLLTATSYLPTQLVLGVAGDIRAGTNASHGWLGVTGTDQPAGAGATVTQVDPASPASGRLAPGEVVVAIDGTAGAAPWPSCGPASTCSRPGTSVALTVLGRARGHAASKVVNVTLGRSS